MCGLGGCGLCKVPPRSALLLVQVTGNQPPGPPLLRTWVRPNIWVSSELSALFCRGSLSVQTANSVGPTRGTKDFQWPVSQGSCPPTPQGKAAGKGEEGAEGLWLHPACLVELLLHPPHSFQPSWTSRPGAGHSQAFRTGARPRDLRENITVFTGGIINREGG